ncbi:hypothetical protein C9I56_39050 [Paraburkholderia caribensis]|uniref:hypothetical protein n=1 Tax=Paraburkholderia caribensis TaxID=75105 RepID=UPI000D15D9FC|nr:hypothetical protein [Paraburkholderia caribensis]PTB23488.1 hypothetical protein C9I56_39050 [Paraburkholderia caribensis]
MNAKQKTLKLVSEPAQSENDVVSCSANCATHQQLAQVRMMLQAALMAAEARPIKPSKPKGRR